MTVLIAGLRPADIPSPSSGVLEIGPLSIHAYGLMIALGVVAAVWLAGRRMEARGVGTRDDMSAIALWAVPAGVIGARLYHVITDWELFEDDLGRIVQIWKGGLGIPGGVLAGTLVALWRAKRRGLDPAGVLDSAAPALPLAQAIGRWGNYFNQELFGKPTDLPWALEVSATKAAQAGYAPGTTFHPTFLYESLWNLGLVGALLAIDRKWKIRPGSLFAMYVIGYGIGRFWVEGLRIDPAKEAGLRLNQWVALGMIIAGGAYLLFVSGRPVKGRPVVGAGDDPAGEPEPDEVIVDDEVVMVDDEAVLDDDPAAEAEPDEVAEPALDDSATPEADDPVAPESDDPASRRYVADDG